MPIDESRQAIAMACIIGPDHSALIPSVIWGGWLDGAGALIGMTGFPVPHDSFDIIDEPGARGVANVVEIDLGLAPATTPTNFGVFEDEAGTQPLAWGPVTFTGTVEEGLPLVASPGGIRLLYMDGATGP